jgi:hypothetical protein
VAAAHFDRSNCGDEWNSRFPFQRDGVTVLVKRLLSHGSDVTPAYELSMVRRMAPIGYLPSLGICLFVACLTRTSASLARAFAPQEETAHAAFPRRNTFTTGPHPDVDGGQR